VDDTAIENFKIQARKQGFQALEEQIVLKDLCSGCGTCSAVCPRNCIEFLEEGVPTMKGNAKCINCGLCAIHCPRSFMDTSGIEKELFSGKRDELGYKVQRIAARTTDPELLKNAQDGGVVSTMLKFLFEKGKIDGAAVTQSDENFVGSPLLATSWEEAKPTSKSKYNLSPNVVALRWARQKKLENMALVGLPCHMAAFRKIEHYGPKNLAKGVGLTIGLFCSENFCDKMVTDYLPTKGVDPKKITKMNIKGKFMVESDGDVTEIPLPEMKAIANPGCLVCRDFSAEFADISVGAVGASNGWCTVITRTEKGDAVLKEMIDAGVLETDKLIKPKTLKRMSRSKRNKGNRKLLEIALQEAAIPLRSAEIPVEEEGSGKK
jgi:coenzyme F420 hydrogenase subunit beta